jgi:hypothetical protein
LVTKKARVKGHQIARWIAIWQRRTTDLPPDRGSGAKRDPLLPRITGIVDSGGDEIDRGTFSF